MQTSLPLRSFDMSFKSLLIYRFPFSHHPLKPFFFWKFIWWRKLVLCPMNFPRLGFADCISAAFLFCFVLFLINSLWWSFIFLLLLLFIYLFLAALGLRFCARAFSSCGKRGPLFITVRGPLTIVASLVAEHRLQTRRLSSCGSRA